MDTAPSDVGTPQAFAPGSPQTEALLEALKAAITASGEHRLFRSGKLAGLFAAKAGSAAEAALFAVRDGLLETVRTETRGKIVTEWVRATPKAVAFVHEHDSPKSVLRELKDVLATARGGIPTWMAEAKQEAALLSARFEERATAMLARLDDLANRVEAALRRAETTGPAVGEQVGRVVPWAVESLEYLDRRRSSGAAGDCPLPELFHAVRVKFPELTLGAFQDGLKRLHDVRALRLLPALEMTEPEYAVVVGGQLMYAAAR
ncbi:MAG: hypothetical protein U0792_07310 [Gemmataceae bacterium]